MTPLSLGLITTEAILPNATPDIAVGTINETTAAIIPQLPVGAVGDIGTNETSRPSSLLTYATAPSSEHDFSIINLSELDLSIMHPPASEHSLRRSPSVENDLDVPLQNTHCQITLLIAMPSLRPEHPEYVFGVVEAHLDSDAGDVA
ncbi:hypothetical protein HWV62_35192 [Athelia sp. TMB]|nr:hypothetical protein HWV62_35192 [Athelia sp. TMB]